MINDEEEFLKEFEDEKVKEWNDSYLDYTNLKNKINKIKDIYFKNKDIKSENDKKGEIEEKKQIKLNEIITSEKKSNVIENIDEIDESLENNNDILSNFSMETEEKLNILGMPTKKFMELLDEQIKKIHIFYTRKEKKLYDDMNLQLRLYESLKNKNNNERKMQIVTDLDYLSNFSYELIKYVYINIKALKRILKIFDLKLVKISYNYLKKNLSKNNCNLVYILNFKILDEVLVVIQQLFLSIKEDLLAAKYFNNKNNEKDTFDESCNEINESLEMIDDLYQDIFDELKPWEKYLKISLGQPTSCYKSVFKGTSFFGDSLFNNSRKEKRKKNKNKSKKISKNKSSIKIEEKEENLIYIKDVDEKLDKINEEKKAFYKNSDLFEKSDIFSYRTKNVLNSSNLRNLKILYALVLFFSFSYSFLIPSIIIMMKDKQFYDLIFLYSIILSVHSLGNYISKFIFKCLINMPFKTILLFYYFIFLVHYALLLFGAFYPKNKCSIVIIIEGRFLLGFSYLRHLSKEYVDQFVPKINQINANKNYMFYLYIGFALGILSNSLYFFNENNFNLGSYKINLIQFLISVYLLLALILFFVVICNFIEPKNNILLNEEFLEETKKHRLSRNLVDNKEKEKAAFHDKNYSIANTSVEFAQTNLLTNFISQHLDMNYYNKICIILLFLLISTEYTRENLLILIPRLFYYIYKIYPNGNEVNKYLFLFSVIFFALFYFLSYIFIRYFLKKHYTMNYKTGLLFIMMFILFILSLSFIILIKPYKKTFDNLFISIIFPQIITSILFMLNEIYHIIIINIFIYLLPSEEIKFCCIKLSSLINFATKFIRIIPSIIIIILYFSFNDEDFENEIILNQEELNYCNIFLFGMQSSIYLICFLLSLFYRSYFRNTSKIRIRNKYI